MQFISSENDNNKLTSEINSSNEDKMKINNFEKLKFKLENFREKSVNILTEFLTFVNGLKENFGKYLSEDNGIAKKNLFHVSKSAESVDNENNAMTGFDVKVMDSNCEFINQKRNRPLNSFEDFSSKISESMQIPSFSNYDKIELYPFKNKTSQSQTPADNFPLSNIDFPAESQKNLKKTNNRRRRLQGPNKEPDLNLSHVSPGKPKNTSICIDIGNFSINSPLPGPNGKQKPQADNNAKKPNDAENFLGNFLNSYVNLDPKFENENINFIGNNDNKQNPEDNKNNNNNTNTNNNSSNNKNTKNEIFISNLRACRWSSSVNKSNSIPRKISNLVFPSSLDDKANNVAAYPNINNSNLFNINSNTKFVQSHISSTDFTISNFAGNQHKISNVSNCLNAHQNEQTPNISYILESENNNAFSANVFNLGLDLKEPKISIKKDSTGIFDEIEKGVLSNYYGHHNFGQDNGFFDYNINSESEFKAENFISFNNKDNFENEQLPSSHNFISNTFHNEFREEDSDDVDFQKKFIKQEDVACYESNNNEKSKFGNKQHFEDKMIVGPAEQDDPKLIELENLRNMQFQLAEDKVDDPDKMKLISKRLLDDFIYCVDVLKKLHETDLDFDKLKDVINSNPISNDLDHKRPKKYKMFTPDFKLKCVELCRYHDFKTVSKRCKVPIKSLKRWILIGPDRKKGGGRKIKDPEMEKKLSEWIYSYSVVGGNPITAKMVKKKALEFRTCNDFIASKGWLEKFKKKFGIVIQKEKTLAKKK